MSGPLLAARFDPSHTHFALASLLLDTHQVKVQALVVTQDLLNTLFQLDKNQKITCLEWLSPLLLAIGLSNGSILEYLPASNAVATEITVPSNAAITDIHYSSITQTLWCSDADGVIYEYDTELFTLLQRLALADMLDSVEKVLKLATVTYEDEPHLLVGTHNVYLVSISGKNVTKSFPAHVQPVISLLPVSSHPDLFLSAAEGDRFINIYSISSNSTKCVLVATSSVVLISLGICDDLSLVAAINETGTLEIFNNPLLAEPLQEAISSSKKRRKQAAAGARSRHADAFIKYSRPEDEIRGPGDETLGIDAVLATASVLHTTWLESASVSRFDAVPWHTDGTGCTLLGLVVVRKSRQEIKPTTHAERGHDIAAPRLYNERHTVVTEGSAFQNDLVHSDDEEDDETLAERMEKLTGASQKLAAANKKKLRKHTAGSLSVVLSQALRNNDHSLLETVLANRDPTVVQNTISRLDASLAVVMLDRLSERITRQKLQFDHMNFWLKWIIIIHGGVLSLMPNLSNKLASLHTVLTKKAATMPRLLELQGRLNMIEQQSSLKREILGGGAGENQDDEADSDVEYIEEIDDAVEAGVLGSDVDDDDDDAEMDMDGKDDFEDASGDDFDDQNARNGNRNVAADDDEGLSDVETAVVNNDVHDG